MSRQNNITDSILKYFGTETSGDTLPVLDDYLEREYRNVILLVIGGMAGPVYYWNMDLDKPFRKHQLKYLSPYNDAQEPVSLKGITGKLKAAGIDTYDLSPCGSSGDVGFQDILDNAKEICGMHGCRFIYAYWPCLEEIIRKCGDCTERNEEIHGYLEDIENRISLFTNNMNDTLLIITGSLPATDADVNDGLSGGEKITGDEPSVPLIVFKDFFFLGTGVNDYVNEALRRLSKKYPWTDISISDKHYTYVIEDAEGKKEFVKYYTWDDNSSKRYAEGWDGELFIKSIICDQRSRIEHANEVKEVFDVMPDYGVDCHGWGLERFEFRSHVLGGYSAFVQAGDRCTGGSREFYFPPDVMSGTFKDFLDKNGELLSGAFGLDREYMEKFEGLKEFLGFKE